MSDEEKAEQPAPEGEATDEGEAPEDGEDAPLGEDGEDAEDGGGKKAALVAKLRENLRLIIVGVVTVAIIGGGVTAFMTGLGEAVSNALSGTPQATMELPGPPVFHEMPLMTVDLKPSKARKRPFIRFIMTVELEDTAVDKLIDSETIILDAAQTFLRTQTTEDLRGDAGTQLLRKKMTDIVSSAIAPDRAIGILFKEIMVR